MLKNEYKDRLADYLKRHPKPQVRPSTTLREGCLSLIEPVSTICGPEVHCREEDFAEVCGIIMRHTTETGDNKDETPWN